MQTRQHSLLSRLLMIFAILLTAFVWIRLIYGMAVNPSPPRWLNVSQDFLDCRDEGFVETSTDSVWLACARPNSSLMRLDLRQGVAQPVGEPFDSPVLDFRLAGFARHADGKVLLLMNKPRPMERFLFSDDRYLVWQPDSAKGEQLERLPLPPEITDGGEGDQFGGAAWVGSNIEVVLWRGAAAESVSSLPINPQITVHRYVIGSGWEDGRAVSLPAVCQPECGFAFAWYASENNEWRFLYNQNVLANEDGSTLPLEVTPPLVADGRYHFDSAVSNVVPRTVFLQSGEIALIYDGDGWSQAPNVLDEEMIAALNSLLIRDGGTIATHSGGNPPRTIFSLSRWTSGDTEAFYLNGEWFLAEDQAFGLTLRKWGDPIPNTPLVVNGSTITAQVPAHPLKIFPSSSGGFWVLSGYGEYLHLNQSLQRTDALSFFERIGQIGERFNRLSTIGQSYGPPTSESAFWVENSLLKLGAFYLILLFLPLGVLVLTIVNRKRVLPSALDRLCLVYVFIFIAGFAWFWQITNAI
ncbi:MAG: hypothetical protein OHK0023_20220 [Anaerolineae bacterium]